MINGREPWPTTGTTAFIIAACVRIAAGKIKRLSRRDHVGTLLVTRKNPPVTNVGLGPGTADNYWSIMLMAI